MTLNDTKSLIKVHSIDICSAVPAKRTSEFIFHASVVLHFFGYGSTHEHLDGHEFGLLAKRMLGRVLVEKSLPGHDIGRVVIWLDATTGEPHGMAVGGLGVWDAVTERCHDSTDRAVDILVGSVWESSHSGLDSECCHNTVVMDQVETNV